MTNKVAIERETLLPCPFCGDDGDKGWQEVTQMIEGRNKFARITCRACGAMCPEENWNRRAALAAQPAPAAVPPGMALVPIEPTPGIITTGTVALMKASDSDLDATREEIAATYRAMIAAAGDKT